MNPNEYINKCASLTASMSLNKDLLVQFCGEINETETDRIIEEYEASFKPDEKPLRKRLLIIAVEMTQNLLRHKMQGLPCSFICLRAGNTLEMISLNYIPSRLSDTLAFHIEKVNNEVGGNIRNLFRESLRNSVISDRGGAGLGFIEMRRKSNNPLMCKFHPVDESLSIFELTVTITIQS